MATTDWTLTLKYEIQQKTLNCLYKITKIVEVQYCVVMYDKSEVLEIYFSEQCK
jgi:hypothetical protein